MEHRWCSACGQAFKPRPQSPGQTYCALAACQKERRRLWQRVKRQSDPDYVANQTKAQRAWLDRHPDYWRIYRRDHPAYVEHNRLLQSGRNQRRKGLERQPVLPSSGLVVAKIDASAAPAGVYMLTFLERGRDAKMDVWRVHLAFVGAPCPS